MCFPLPSSSTLSYQNYTLLYPGNALYLQNLSPIPPPRRVITLVVQFNDKDPLFAQREKSRGRDLGACFRGCLAKSILCR